MTKYEAWTTPSEINITEDRNNSRFSVYIIIFMPEEQKTKSELDYSHTWNYSLKAVLDF